MAVATDPAIHIVCELMGGTGIAREVTLAALSRGKVVVSANKALICAHGAEIFAAARRGGGHFLFEASVAGGIPLIKAVREGLVANRFPRIYGILNGTCNYILTKMEELDAPYASVLREAKRLGYAEKPRSRSTSRDGTPRTRRRILAWLAHGVWVRPRADDRRGDRADHARRLQERRGARLRDQAPGDHHARLRDRTRSACASTRRSYPKDGVLARVSGVFNAISVTGDVVGTTLYIGRGAGQDATASAVISDIADAVALLLHGKGAHFMGEEEPPALGRGAGWPRRSASAGATTSG